MVEAKRGALAARRPGRSLGRLGLRQQQLLQVGGAILVDLDAGEGLVQGNVLDLHLLADAVVRQPGEGQGMDLQQPLIVSPIDHLELIDIEPPLQGQLAQLPLRRGGEIKAGLAAQQPVLHLDPHQIGQIRLRQRQGQPLLADLAIQGKGRQGQLAIKGEGAALVEVGGQSQFARLLPLAAQRPQCQLEIGELTRQRLAAARFGEGEIPLVDGDLLDLPLPGCVCRMFLGVTGCLCLLCRLGRRIVDHLVCGVGFFDGFAGSLCNEQIRQIQLLPFR